MAPPLAFFSGPVPWLILAGFTVVAPGTCTALARWA